MRSAPTFTKLTGLAIVIALIALGGFSQISVRAGVPAQATTAATMAATTASSGGASAAATMAATTAASGGSSAAATMAATTASSGGASASSGTTFPPCPPAGTASAAATTAAVAPTAAATGAASAATPNANPGYLGIRAEQVDDCGVRVVEVVAGQPASKSTLKADDVIVAMDGAATADILTLRQMVQNHQPGDSITLTVENASGQSNVSVTLGPVPATAGAVATAGAAATAATK